MNTFSEIKDESLYRALTAIRELPGLWLSKKSLKLLDIYIDGFLAGKSDMRKPFYYPKWFKQFTKYVADVCVEGNGCYGIVNAIYENGYDDENGIDRFYQLLDDFCMEKYPDKDSECMTSEPENLAVGEIRAVEIGRDAICELAQKYIHDNFNEIFDLEDEERFISTRVQLCLWDKDRERLKIVAYDTNDCKSSVEAANMIKDVEISAKTLLCDKPYTVIKVPEED